MVKKLKLLTIFQMENTPKTPLKMQTIWVTENSDNLKKAQK